jgi:hypothetical protein
VISFTVFSPEITLSEALNSVINSCPVSELKSNKNNDIDHVKTIFSGLD